MLNQVVLWGAVALTLAPTTLAVGLDFTKQRPCTSNNFYDSYIDLQTATRCDSPHVSIVNSFHGTPGCNAAGTLKLALASATEDPRRRGVIIDMFFDNPQGYTFNIGDSVSNDAWGQDGGDTEYNAELHAMQNTGFRIYRSSKGLYRRKSVTDAFSTRLTVYIRNGRVEWNSGQQTDFLEDPNLFALGGQTDDAWTGNTANYDLYVGVNKVIKGRSRTGTGLCRIGIRFVPDTYSLYDAVYNLERGTVCDSPFVNVIKPFSGTGCDTKGVLEILLANPGMGNSRRGVLIDLEFGSNPTGYTFNVGDSHTNNGLGGDNGNTEYDAELHAYQNTSIRLYRNDKARYRRGRRETYWNQIKDRLTIIIKDQQVQWITDDNVAAFSSTKNELFALGGQTDDTQGSGVPNYEIYVGLNRVILDNIRRTGSGLCKASIRFLNEDWF